MLQLANPSALSLWERGKRTPSTRSVAKLARVLKVPISYFYDRDSCVPRTHPEVTRRQQQILYGLAAGLSHAEMATGLGVSRRTIDFHHRDLNRILGVSNVVLLLRESVRLRLLPRDVLSVPRETLIQKALG
ncbi:helix-turn-helix domain-containing protein [Candidatus Nitrospira bockiana]